MKWLKRILIGVGAVVGLLLLYLLLWPVPIDPAAWKPPPAPGLTGIYEPNTLLFAVEKLGVGAGMAPEDVDVDDRGRIYGGMKDGRIMRFQPGQARLSGCPSAAR